MEIVGTCASQLTKFRAALLRSARRAVRARLNSATASRSSAGAARHAPALSGGASNGAHRTRRDSTGNSACQHGCAGAGSTCALAALHSHSSSPAAND